jgi:ketosteroid isomerase-like protein
MGNRADDRASRGGHSVAVAGGVRPPNQEIPMSAEQNLRIVQDMYAAFGRGDVAFVLEQIDDESDGFGVVSATKTGVPWHVGTDVKGKAGAARYFESLAPVDHDLFEQRDFAASGDHVYATVRLVQTVRATGKRVEQPEVVHHWTFRKGKVIRCRVLEDTAATRSAFAKG